MKNLFNKIRDFWLANYALCIFIPFILVAAYCVGSIIVMEQRKRTTWLMMYHEDCPVSFSGLRGVIVATDYTNRTITVLIDGTRNIIKLNVNDQYVTVLLSEGAK